MEPIHNIIAAGTALFGVFLFIFPDWGAGFVGLGKPGPRGRSEIRVLFGGLFAALGAAPFLLGAAPVAFRMLGIAYLGAALTRLAAIGLDRTPDRSNIVTLLVEGLFGVLLLL